MISTILGAFRVGEIRNKLLFTAGDPRALPARDAHPGARDQLRGRQRDPEELRRQQHLRPAEPVLGRRPRADRDLRARDHALHHRLDHPAAADGRRPVAREAAEGGRGRPGADHPVHALPDRRPRVRAVDRLRVPVQSFQKQAGRDADPELQPGQGVPDRDLADRRHGAADVDGRADHPARDRQRDLAADLREHRRADPATASTPGGPTPTRCSA